jgi:hypothetical protein
VHNARPHRGAVRPHWVEGSHGRPTSDRLKSVSKGRIPSLRWGVWERQDSPQKQTYANRTTSDIASATSGISGVAAKPSSASVRTVSARAARALQGQQLDKAQRAEELMRALADVAIIALIDEATGYQQFRARDELQKILAAYISPDLLPWSQRFPQNFYAELHRVRGWKYAPGSNKRNDYIGKLTNELIYKQLPSGVLDELRKKNPVDPSKKRRKFTHHQFLTEDIGNPHLEKQIVSVTTFLSVSDGWNEFARLFCKRFPPGPNDLFSLPPPSEK